MLCPQCHTENTSSTLHCKQCGKYLEPNRSLGALTQSTAPAPNTIICPQCGTHTSAASLHCSHCGKYLEPSAPSAVTAQTHSQSSNNQAIPSNNSSAEERDQGTRRVKCPFCAEEILPDAKKCRYCGEWLVDTAERSTPQQATPLHVAPAPNQAPAIAIATVYLRTQGPTEIRKRVIRASDTGRGFYFACALVDAANQWTTADGELILYLSMQEEAIGANDKGIHRKETGVSWQKMINGWSGVETSQLQYVYSQMEPVFTFSDASIYPHVWFRTYGGVILYKMGDSITWK